MSARRASGAGRCRRQFLNALQCLIPDPRRGMPTADKGHFVVVIMNPGGARPRRREFPPVVEAQTAVNAERILVASNAVSKTATAR